MILINYISEEIKQIKEMFYQRIKHPYITKFLNEPILDEDRLFLLYLMLEEKKLSKKSRNDYIITTLLVQAALDTHETVSTSTLKSDKGKKQRQLTVLAGDYYSSLYYYLLAKVNDIPMIRLLASSIQEVNEAKMSFYKEPTRPISQSIEDVKLIESSLIQKVAEHFKLPIRKHVVSEFFFLKRLVVERNRLLEGGKVPLLEAIINGNRSSLLGLKDDSRLKYSLELCDNYIFESKSQLYSLCQQPTNLNSFIIERIDEMLLDINIIKEKVAEEG
ncbi:heptaprenyl diphosphate synthase component 1 [Bacillaceae bacterium IKA-2]|nr:heptaprenyl diphosphate synthase component 1 [Bacillaceae bacterium IKA-2]